MARIIPARGQRRSGTWVAIGGTGPATGIAAGQAGRPANRARIKGLAFRDTIQLLAALLACGSLAASATATPASASVTYVTEWGRLGSGDGQFGGPLDLAATPTGTVFVSDTFDNRLPHIQAFATGGSFLRSWGAAGAGNGQFAAPGGIAVGRSGTVYVGDHSLDRIQRFGADGTYLGQWGSSGSGPGQFASPWGIATDPRGRVYVVDYGNHRVQRFSPDGDFLGQWGSFGSGDGQFLSPSFIATGSGGLVYVADSGNSRIQKFRANGRYLTEWQTPGPGVGPPDYPLGIATGARGAVYVVGTTSVQKYSPRGRLITRWGEQGRGRAQFRNPQGVATDAAGNVYVGDSGNDRVQKFHDAGPPYPDPGAARLRTSSPAKVKARAGGHRRLPVRVRNTGSSRAKRVRVCLRRPGRSARALRASRCRGLGSIAPGRKRVARLRLAARCAKVGSPGLIVRAVASNASAAKSRTRVKIAGCSPSKGRDR